MPLLRRLGALCAAYAVALQVIVAGLAAPQLDIAFNADALVAICTGSGERPAPVGPHDGCVLCVMPGGCVGHALPGAGGAIVPTPVASVAAAPAAPTDVLAVARPHRSHAARAPPAA
jgi:hypothetical protein